MTDNPDDKAQAAVKTTYVTIDKSQAVRLEKLLRRATRDAFGLVEAVDSTGKPFLTAPDLDDAAGGLGISIAADVAQVFREYGVVAPNAVQVAVDALRRGGDAPAVTLDPDGPRDADHMCVIPREYLAALVVALAGTAPLRGEPGAACKRKYRLILEGMNTDLTSSQIAEILDLCSEELDQRRSSL